MNTKRLTQMFMDWADEHFPAGHAAAGDAGASARGAKTWAAMTGFRQRHRDFLHGLIAGTVQVVDLDNIRKRFGTRWPEMQAGVHRIADACIQKRLDPGDRFARIGDDGYVVQFGHLSQSQVAAKVAEIAEEVTRLACGTQSWSGTLTLRRLDPSARQHHRIEGMRSIGDLECGFAAALARFESRERLEFERMRPALGIGFWPMFSVAKRLVSVYEGALTRPSGTGDTRIGEAAYPATDIGQLTCALDCHALELVGERLGQFNGRRRNAFVIASLHYATLAAERYRTQYLAAAGTLPAGSRNHLILQVLDPPPGTPSAHLPDIRAWAPANIRGLVCRVGPEPGRIDGVSGDDVLGLSMDAAAIAPTAEQSLRELGRFLGDAKAARIRTLLTGIASRSLATAAAAAGFQYMGGQALIDLVQTPGRVYRLS